MIIKNKTSQFLILILIVVCLSLSLSSKLEAAFWDMLNSKEVPVFPAFKEMNKKKLVINGISINFTTFKGENISIPQVVEYYKNILPQSGWQERATEPAKSFLPGNSNTVVLNFTNEDGRAMQLMIFSGKIFKKPDAVYMHLRCTLEGTEKWIKMESENDTDMPGQDIPWLKRYPASIRIESTIDDNGIFSGRYLVPNYSCVNCVIEFYKEELSKAGWNLLKATHKTKEEIISNLSSFDLKKYLDKMPEELKEKLNTGVKNSSILEKDLPQMGKELSLPHEAYAMSFQNNKGSSLTINIAYKESEDDNQQQGSDEQAAKEVMAKYMGGILKTNRLAYLATIQGDSKQTVIINIMYFPKLKSEGLSKPWY